MKGLKRQPDGCYRGTYNGVRFTVRKTDIIKLPRAGQGWVAVGDLVKKGWVARCSAWESAHPTRDGAVQGLVRLIDQMVDMDELEEEADQLVHQAIQRAKAAAKNGQKRG